MERTFEEFCNGLEIRTRFEDIPCFSCKQPSDGIAHYPWPMIPTGYCAVHLKEAQTKATLQKMRDRLES